MAIDVPDPVAASLADDEAKDADALSRCFTEDGTVHDERRNYRGRDAIRQWKQAADEKYRYVLQTVNAQTVIFSQGSVAGTIMYIQDGGVKITALSASGKEAIIATLGPGEVFGEGSMAGQPLRMASATAITPSTVLIVDKDAMQEVLHEQHELSDLFI